MANGQQLAQQNFMVFATWSRSCTDEDFKQIVYRGNLSRKVIAAQCGFGLSALNQNPSIKKALSELETNLRYRGILPAIALRQVARGSIPPLMAQASDAGRLLGTKHARRLEQENTSLKFENAELKRELDRFTIIREVLAETGRFPR
jgi:hypothetical protein